MKTTEQMNVRGDSNHRVAVWLVGSRKKKVPQDPPEAYDVAGATGGRVDFIGRRKSASPIPRKPSHSAACRRVGAAL